MNMMARYRAFCFVAAILAMAITTAGAYGAVRKFVTMTNQTSVPAEDTIHIVQAVTVYNDDAEREPSAEDMMLLKLGMSEAGTESVDCIKWVMQTALNRVESDEFPDNLYDVIHQENQFSVVPNGTYDTAIPNEKCYEALLAIRSGWDGAYGALYFESLEYEDNWFRQNLTYLCQIDSMRFYK